MSRPGKIARLPREIRDQLNRRLDDGETGKDLVPWLNELPEVKKVLAEQFGGRPVSGQNLSEWKVGGFLDWQVRQETLLQSRELAADLRELTDTTGGSMADHVATVLAARYAAALLGWNGQVTDEFRRKLRALRGLCQDIVQLRRGDHSVVRLHMEQEQRELERKKEQEEIQKRRDPKEPLSDEDRKAIVDKVDEVLGVKWE